MTATVPVDLQAASVRPDDELTSYRSGRAERRRVMTVTHGAHYVELRHIRLTERGGRWFPDGDLQRTTCAAHDRISVYPKGRS